MRILRLFIILALFIFVLSQDQIQIKDKEQYIQFKGYRHKLMQLNESGTLSEDYSNKLDKLIELLDDYEEANPQSGDDDTNPSSVDTTPPLVQDLKSVTVEKIEPAFCTLHLEINKEYNIEDDLNKLVEMKYIHLLKYKIDFYKLNESDIGLIKNASEIYGIFTWYHTFTDHGKNLLSLKSDFHLKSLTLLTSGIEELSIKIYENKDFCFSQLNPEDQKSKLSEFILDHFFDKSKMGYLYEHNLCYQKIDIKNTRGKFVYECCNLKNECKVVENVYIDLFTMFQLIFKLVFVLLCPLIIQKLFFSKNIGKFNYTVPVHKPGLKKTMLIKRVNSDYETVHRSSKYLPGNKSMQLFSNFRKLVRSIPSDEIISVNFSLLDVTIDHAELLSKNDSPIQFMQYIYSTVIRCQCGRSHPFRTCCGESIVGSWSPNFLWCRLQKKCETNNSCRECLSWFAIFRFFSTILLILLLPLPFYVKVLYYYNYEKEILDERKNALESLGIDENIFQILVKGVYKYICYLGLFLCYFISASAFVLLRALFPSQIKMIINQCVRDFMNINRFECFRMIVAHFVLPFEKFGILGVVVGVFYWPIVIPISILLTIIYCIPMIYIIGRMFILERPQCIDGSASNQVSIRYQGSHSISRNVSTIANCFFLEHISPKNKMIECNVSHEKPLKKSKFLFCCSFDKTKLLSLIKNIIIGIIFITLLLSLSVMYTEALGFFLEIVFLSVLGAFLNGKENVFYLIFALIVLFYITLFLHHIKWKYSSFSHKLFETIQSKLKNDVMKKMVRCREVREYTAFKYFTLEEMKDKAFKNDVRMRSDMMMERVEDSDNIEYLSGKLHWTVNSLVMFMDGQDVIRMPRDLYWRICNLNIPSSPGPVWKTLFLSTVKLLAAFLYLGILFLIILFYTDTQSEYRKWLEEDKSISKPSNVLKICFLLILGLLPSVVYIIVQFCRCRREAPMVGEGISWIIKSYRKSWPVSDLVFENPESPKGKISDLRSRNAAGDANDSARVDDGEASMSNNVRNEIPLKVDLLITLKDEPVYDPNRISMASNGSVQSLSSINKLSPEEVRPPLKQSNLASVPQVANKSSLQRPLLSNTESSSKNTTVDIELNELQNKLESHVT